MVIIENVFGSVKNRFQIINSAYKLSNHSLGKTARCCFINNNILTLYQSPMRK